MAKKLLSKSKFFLKTLSNESLSPIVLGTTGDFTVVAVVAAAENLRWRTNFLKKVEKS